MTRYVAAIDQGTTSTRCILFDRAGPVAAVQKEHRQILPRPGWVEHDAMEIWQKTQACVREVLEVVGARQGDIAAVGVANQRETTVVWDKRTGRPYGNAIVWQDTRTKALCDALAREGGLDRFRKVTGLPLATYFSGPKLAWMLEHVEGLRAAADRGEALFGTIDTWLIWWLTGGPNGGRHVTDPTNASRTLLMDIRERTWDAGMLTVMGVPEKMLPRIVPSSHAEALGKTTAGGPFGSAVVVGGDLGDQQAALVGQGCFAAGESKNTYGTGCFMLLNTGTRVVESAAGLLTTVGYQLEEGGAVYALEGSIAVAGALVQWLRDNLGMIASAGEVEGLARSVADNGGCYMVPAFSGLFAPYWRSDARGVIAGLTRYTNRGHLARAVLEATAYQTRDVLDAMRQDARMDVAALKVDGGMAANELLMQFQADMLNLPVIRPRVTETTAQGAAYAAGLAVGFWANVEEVRAMWREDRRWIPGMDAEARENHYACWKKAVERSMGWL